MHGLPTEWQPPDTQVAWREEVSALNIKPWIEWSQKEFEKFAFELLDDYPLKPHEILKDNSKRVFERLKKLKAPPEIPVWIQSQDGAVKLTTLGVVVDGDSDDLNYLTVILPPEAGGLNEQGMLDEKSANPVKDVADELFLKDKSGEKVQQRVRKWEAKPNKMKLVQDIEFRTSEDEDAEPSKIWYWFVRPTFADADAKASQPYDLQPHLDDAKAAAEQFVKVLVPNEKIRVAIALAAGFHDLGKDRRRWQRGIGNAEYPTKKLAKSGNRRAATERSSYRHEFGSLLDVADRDEFKNLDPDMKELVLHLIAAHHGRARPLFPANEAFDDNYSEDRALALANEVPRRFARLQRKYGRWGLAYLESLVRAADILASKKAEGSDS